MIRLWWGVAFMLAIVAGLAFSFVFTAEVDEEVAREAPSHLTR